MSTRELLLEVRNLSVDYGHGESAIHALDDVSLALHRGEVLGIAGESGCGKSTLAFAMTRLLRPPGRVTSGEVLYHGRDGAVSDVLRMTSEELQAFRWESLAIVFQSAMNALNPVMTLRQQLDDVLRSHRPDMDKRERLSRIIELLQVVGISADRAAAYPHELSGGMRQRAMIAVSLALQPDIVVMDEPTTALDVVMQRKVVTQIMSLRRRFGFSVIFVTHDLSLLVEMADTVAVMYAGKVVESAPAGEVYRKPRHPYSQGLLRSFPALRGPRQTLTGIPGSPPDLNSLPAGCAFHPRCKAASELCAVRTPCLAPSPVLGDSEDHAVSCLIYSDPDFVPVIAPPVEEVRNA